MIIIRPPSPHLLTWHAVLLIGAQVRHVIASWHCQIVRICT